MFECENEIHNSKLTYILKNEINNDKAMKKSIQLLFSLI
jgi:hypothetical protein